MFPRDQQTPSASTHGERFLAAFVSLEESLQKLAQLRDRTTIKQMLETAKAFSPGVREYEDDIRELAELRNAIVHGRRNNQLIAEPHEDVVRELESIAAVLAGELPRKPVIPDRPWGGRGYGRMRLDEPHAQDLNSILGDELQRRLAAMQAAKDRGEDPLPYKLAVKRLSSIRRRVWNMIVEQGWNSEWDPTWDADSGTDSATD